VHLVDLRDKDVFDGKIELHWPNAQLTIEASAHKEKLLKERKCLPESCRIYTPLTQTSHCPLHGMHFHLLGILGSSWNHAIVFSQNAE
jgi:hypothetical protein